MEFSNVVSDLLPIVKKSAPIVASILGGASIFGIPVGPVVSLIATKFGVDQDSLSTLPQAISLDADADKKLLEIESCLKLCLTNILPNTRGEISIKLGWGNSSQ